MADTWAVSEGALSPESNPVKSFLSGLTNFSNEVLSIKAAGYLNQERKDAGLQYGKQSAAYQDNEGRNLNSSDTQGGRFDHKTIMYAGGGVLALAAIWVALK